MPDFPRHPNFSIWRMLVRSWVEFVYMPKRSELEAIFFKYLLHQRVNHFVVLKRGGKDHFKKIKSTIFRLSDGFENGGPHDEVEEEMMTKGEFITEVLERFAESVLDISIDEITVHGLGHTSVGVEKPYKKVELKLVRDTEKLCAGIPMCSKDIQTLVSLDCRLLSRLFIPRTLHRHFQTLTKTLLSRLDPTIKTDPGIPPLQVSFEQLLAHSDSCQDNKKLKVLKDEVIKQMIHSDFSSDEEEDFHVKKANSMALKERSADCDRVTKSFLKRKPKQATASMKKDAQEKEVSKIVDEQESLKSILIQLGKKCQEKFFAKDSTIDRDLKRKCIPFDLGEDGLFYSFCSSINLNFINVKIKQFQTQLAQSMDEEVSETHEMEESQDDTTHLESERKLELVEEFLIPWMETVLADHVIFKGDQTN